MDLDYFRVYFPRLEEPTAEQIQEAFERGIDAGWTTTRDGMLDRCIYTDPANDRYAEWKSTGEAIEELAKRSGSIVIFPDDPDFDFNFNVHSTWSEAGLPELGGISLTWHRTLFRNDAEKATRELFKSSKLVYESILPPFAFSYLPLDIERVTTVTQNDLEEQQIPDVFWAMFLSEHISNQIGRDRLLTSPAWKSEPLADDGVGLVVTADPNQYTLNRKEQLKESLGIG